MDKALRVVSHALDAPSLEAVAECWRAALPAHFAHVTVDVRPCPDLREAEWGLAAPSICGNVEILDVGGPPNVERADKRNVLETSLEEVGALAGRRNAFYWGAGATSARVVPENAELMPNACVGVHGDQVLTQYAKTVDNDSSFATLPYPSTRFGNLCNVGVADGTPGAQCIYVDVRQRVGETNVVDALCKALHAMSPTQQISCCGVFRIESGAVRAHVMPPFPSCDLATPAEVQQWLKFFPMDAPLVCLSVFHSSDQHNVGLRLQHTHFFSNHGHGGHYHFDTTPANVHYRGFFTVASRVHKVDVAT